MNVLRQFLSIFSAFKGRAVVLSTSLVFLFSLIRDALLFLFVFASLCLICSCLGCIFCFCVHFWVKPGFCIAVVFRLDVFVQNVWLLGFVCDKYWFCEFVFVVSL